MGKLVVTEFVSLDGVFEGPGGGDFEHAGWTFRFDRGEDGDRFKLDELRAADAQLLGRITYEGFAAAWPSMTDEVGFAEQMNSMPKYVVSSTLDKADWANSVVLRGDLRDEVQQVKDAHGGELHLMVFPVVLGSGRRLLDEGTATTTFTLTDMGRVGPEGVVVMTYAPRPGAR
jgi:dihydrofolate reductase